MVLEMCFEEAISIWDMNRIFTTGLSTVKRPKIRLWIRRAERECPRGGAYVCVCPANRMIRSRFRRWLNAKMRTYDKRVRPHFGKRPLSVKLGIWLISISSVSEANMVSIRPLQPLLAPHFEPILGVHSGDVHA